MGTADYMAPEQTSDSRTVDIRADIYGLGATLYKLLSGRAPFSGPEYQGTFEKMQAHRQTPPPPIRQYCPDIPDGLVAVLDRMLAKDPAARYQTPSEAAEALAPFCAGSDLPNLLRRAEASDVSPLPLGEGQGEGRTLPKPQPAPRRWRTIAAVVIALLLVGGLGFWLGVMIHIRNQNGDEATLNVPNGSNVDIDNRGKATVTLAGAASKGEQSANADLQREIAKLTVELAGQRALLLYVDQSDVPPSELDALVQSEPAAKQMATELGWKKMDQTYAEGSMKNAKENPYAKRYREEIDRLQKQYDKRVNELKAKARQNKRSVIQTEIVRLQAQLAALRQQEGGPQDAAAPVPAAFDAKAIQGTWEIVSSTFSLIDRLPGEENVSDYEVRETTKIVITADTFRVMGKYVFNRAFDYQLNPDAKPKIVDFQANGGMNIYLGIYQLSGNKLKICATQRTADTSQRPTEFWAEFGGGKELLVLRRVGGVVVSEDEKKILGTWRVESQSVMGGGISLFSQGQKVVIEPREMKFIGWGTINRIGGFGVGGTSTTLVAPPAETQDSTVAEAYYALDSTSQPKALDIDGSGGGGPINAIYKLQGDRLTLCYGFGEGLGQGSIEGSPRPTKFAADEKTNTALVVLKRVAEPAAMAGAKAIQGTWEIVSNTTWGLISTLPGEEVGAPKIMLPGEEFIVPDQVRKTTKIVIDADTFKIIGKHVKMKVFEYRLKADADPKVIALQTGGEREEHGPASLDARLGIFELTSGELRFCIQTPGQPWEPSKLVAALHGGRESLVLRRVGDVVVSADEKAIQGTWRVETTDAYCFRRDQLVTIASHTMTLWRDRVGGRDEEQTRGEYLLDPASEPKRMEINGCYFQQCIYELQGDRLALCYFLNSGRNGPFWPTKFAADNGTQARRTQARLVVLKRVAEPAGKIGGQRPQSPAEKPKEAALQFGPVIERVVNARSEGKGKDAIDLADGKLVDLPKDFDAWPAVTRHNWCGENNVDLFVTADPVPAGLNTLRPVGTPAWQLAAPNGWLQLAAVWNDRWDNTASKWDLRAALDSTTPGKATTLGGLSIQDVEVYERRGTDYFDIVAGLPVTFAFKTAHGDLGLLQVLRYTQEPRGMRIRYKLAQPPVPRLRPAASPALPEVAVCRPVVRDVTDSMDFVGRVEASQTVDVRSRVGGGLEKVLFTGGATVKQGDLLFEIDPRQYQAELDKRAADLSAAKIRAQHATAELERAKPLAKSRSISTSDMDRVESERKEAQAAVLAAEANLKLAKINLDSTRILAAINGRIGRPQLSVGNLVTAGADKLATIYSEQMCVVFGVDERSVLNLRERAAAKKANNGKDLEIAVRCGVADEKGFPRRSTIESKDERMDPATGEAHWRAALPNPDGVLMPGMFARVQLSVGSPHKALLIPEQSLRSDQGRRFVFVIDKKNTVEVRHVEIGQPVGNLRGDGGIGRGRLDCHLPTAAACSGHDRQAEAGLRHHVFGIGNAESKSRRFTTRRGEDRRKQRLRKPARRGQAAAYSAGKGREEIQRLCCGRALALSAGAERRRRYCSHQVRTAQSREVGRIEGLEGNVRGPGEGRGVTRSPARIRLRIGADGISESSRGKPREDMAANSRGTG